MPRIWVVLASGASLTKHDVELVRVAKEQGIITGVIAVSNVGLDIAPWADCLVSHDSAWWHSYPESAKFKGEKVCANSILKDGIKFRPHRRNGCNSGLMAMEYAWRNYKATRILMLGFDMHGSHYFGKHTRPRLKNTDKRRFAFHIQQFNDWKGPEAINCTLCSALKYFPFKPLEECLIDAANQRV